MALTVGIGLSLVHSRFLYCLFGLIFLHGRWALRTEDVGGQVDYLIFSFSIFESKAEQTHADALMSV